MTYIFNTIFFVSIMQVFLYFFAISFELIFKCDFLFLKMYCKADQLFLIKKVEVRFVETAACRKKSTEDSREQSITEDPEEGPITKDRYQDCKEI